MPTRIYEYGLLPPDVNADLVFEQMRLAHRYYNRLIEVERARRASVRQALAAHPDVAQIDADVRRLVEERDQVRRRISAHRAATRSRKVPADLTAQARDLGAQIKARRVELKAAKQSIAGDAAMAAAIAAHTAEAAAQVRAAREACGVYWGSYLLVEAAMDAARKGKTDPDFRRFTGDGRVSVQLQGGISVDEMFADDTQVQVVTRQTTDPALEARIAGAVATRADLRARWKAAGDRDALLRARALSKEIHALRAQNVGYRRKSRRPSLHGETITTARLRLRVQSDERGRPVWAEWPMILDRPLPRGARIKVVTVQKRRRDSASHEWRAHVMLDVTDCQIGRPGEGACALNLGWCQKPADPALAAQVSAKVAEQTELRARWKATGDEVARRAARALSSEIRAILARQAALRVGYVVGDDGAEHEIVLPRSILDRVEKSESIQGYRDDALNAIQRDLGAWIGPRRESSPPWFQEEVRTLHAWKSPGRFARLAAAWKEPRVRRDTGEAWGGRWDGDAEGYDLLAAWLRRDRHLEQYQSGLRRGAHRHRRDIYRCFAKAMATRYRTLVVDDTDLRDFQRDPRPEDGREKIAVAARNQAHASPHELRLVLVSAFMRAGEVVKLSAKDVTRRHVACGSIEDWDRASPVREHTCGKCDATYDQDANACLNLLREHQGSSAGGEGARAGEAPVTKKESRSERLRRHRWKRPESEPLAP